MKHLLIIAIAATMTFTANAQKAYTTSKDEETGAVIYRGPITLADLNGEPTFTWLKRGETAYTPDSSVVKYLRGKLPAYTVVTLMGTWCDDSQNLVPKLAKTLEASRFPMKQFIMYGVDRAKQTGGIESKLYDVKRVPTIIVYKGNIELGRIVESVKRNVETDLMQIILKDAKQD